MRILRYHHFLWITSILILLIVSSCKNDPPKKDMPLDQNKIKQQFIKANQQVVVKENDEMDYYQRSHQMDFTRTGSGIRYFVYHASTKGDSIKNGDIIKINYKLFLLDGTQCYSSAEDGPREFKVGMENIEDGLQKALVFLKNGDKSLILIPSHLAHGLLGDLKKIPPQSPILYDIEVLSVKKQSNPSTF